MNILNNRFVQALIVFIVIFGICMVAGITVNIQAGAAGFHFSVDRSTN